MKQPPLQSFQTENFKGIRDSGTIDFGWLTALVGNNGVGKSCLVEAMETFRDVVLHGVDAAFGRWRGFEHALNKASERKPLKRAGQRTAFSDPMKFTAEWQRRIPQNWKFSQSITQGPGGTLFIQREQIVRNRQERTEQWTRSDKGEVAFHGERAADAKPESFELAEFADGESMFKQSAGDIFASWQFLMLNPERMGQPTAQQRATREVRLMKDGANVAE